MTPRTKEQNEEIRLRRLAQIRKAAAEVYVNTGSLMEIRDVAVQAGLGYGTVYHYYSNKADLLHDLLWDALERAAGWLEGKAAAAGSRSLAQEAADAAAGLRMGEDTADAAGGLRMGEDTADAAAGLRMGKDTADAAAGLRMGKDTADAAAGRRASLGAADAATMEPGLSADASFRLLRLWAEDPALYLLHKLAGEGFAPLPAARSAPLMDAYRREVLAPLAVRMERGRDAEASSAADADAPELPLGLRRAEMLLAALAGCALLSLRRGRLSEEAADIVHFLTGAPNQAVKERIESR
ncbi:helix-turn-helix transcriptional regulator [Paenibacillus albicereus]|uniref:Helix-turn-helix transcriptional regulator n=1 Tax=Paenibacillus albicereus TaxID=2726185 RepID=A0A6H2GUP8_9BACL|nr:TetR family transcriptional regulator [Paenibacillus albicereus]QJC51151.1 helix-turn-helix transcriptional regulator [Paenibacillus albicereus]